MNEMQKTTLFNMPAFIIFGFSKNSNKFNIKKYAPRIAYFGSIILKSKKLQLTILVVLGILIYHFISNHYIVKDQKTVKGKMRQYQQRDFVIHMMTCSKYFLAHLNIFSFLIKTKTDKSNVRPFKPQRHKPSKYDSRIDYNNLVWQLYYESHKGEEVAEDLKRMMDSYKPENYWKIKVAKNN
ncbi:hypothetical protein C1645_734975 [Glomus cerebriforme]|uniref:Uncharacterized protein n=1 Tax=Glomus cerebriforme TaxID=658196 RepID=A0A397T7G0_9GLOM|nr:hypothetical protein C1645_734975 [Glomus cerebriforme]